MQMIQESYNHLKADAYIKFFQHLTGFDEQVMKELINKITGNNEIEKAREKTMKWHSTRLKLVVRLCNG